MTSDIRRFRLSHQLLETCANIGLTLILLAVLSKISLAQTAARPDRGTGPGSSYAISDIENINLTNGNVNLSIPLASLPPVAGGRLGLVVRAEYDSKLWDRAGLEAESPLVGRYTRNVIQLGDGGWGVSGGSYYISVHQLQEDYTPIPPASSQDPEYYLTNYRWKMMLTTPDGARHELRPLDYQSYPGTADYRRGYYKDTPSADSVNATIRYYSFDGSYIWAKIDPYPAFGFPTSWTVYLPDGTSVEQSNGIQRIKDPNGNKIKIFTDTAGTVSTTHYQDELTGREIKVTFDIATYTGQVQYQVVGGAWAAVDIVYGTTHVQGTYLYDSVCSSEAQVDTDLTVIRSITLPQTEPGVPSRQFTFSYNSDTTDGTGGTMFVGCPGSPVSIPPPSHGWGSLSQMTTPQGAVVEYSYTWDGVHPGYFDPDNIAGQTIAQKEVTHDGITETWTYNNDNNTSSSVTAPDGSVTTETRYASHPGYAHSLWVRLL